MRLVSSRFAIIVALYFAAVVFTIALTFATLELPTLFGKWLSNYFLTINPTVELEPLREYMAFARPIGYACLLIVIVLIVIGFASGKRGLSVLGSFVLFSPTFAYLFASMFVLAGTGFGMLRLPIIPFWNLTTNLANFGDISYLPYMAVVYPFSLAGIDVRMATAWGAVGLGLFMFMLGTAAWLYGKMQKRETIDFWIYKFSRHPQYLGFIIWNYGIMLMAALSQVTFEGRNPGASLPWLITSLIIICIALAEEINMSKRDKEGYLKYRASAPFLLYVPKCISGIITAPIRFLLKKNEPKTGKELIATFAIYAVVFVLLSLPFVLFHWPPGVGWAGWPA